MMETTTHPARTRENIANALETNIHQFHPDTLIIINPQHSVSIQLQPTTNGVKRTALQMVLQQIYAGIAWQNDQFIIPWVQLNAMRLTQFERVSSTIEERLRLAHQAHLARQMQRLELEREQARGRNSRLALISDITRDDDAFENTGRDRLGGSAYSSGVFRERVTGDLWLGKADLRASDDFGGGLDEGASEGMACLEIIAAGIYAFYGAVVPKTMLSKQAMTNTGIPEDAEHSVVHLMSRLVENLFLYKDQSDFRPDRPNPNRSVQDAVGHVYEERGLGTVLAIADWIRDYDVIAAGGNIGFQILHNTDGQPYAQTIKIDTGAAFNMNPDLTNPPARHIRVALQAEPNTIAFDNLPPQTKREYLLTLHAIINSTEADIMRFFTRFGGDTFLLHDGRTGRNMIQLLLDGQQRLRTSYVQELRDTALLYQRELTRRAQEEQALLSAYEAKREQLVQAEQAQLEAYTRVQIELETLQLGCDEQAHTLEQVTLELQNSRQQITTLQQQLQVLETQVPEHEAARLQIEAEATHLRQQIAQAQAQEQQLQNQHAQIEQNLQQQRQREENLQQQMAALQQASHAQVEQHEQEREQLEQTIAQLRQTVAVTEQALNQNNAQATQREQVLAQRLTQAEQTIEQLQAQLNPDELRQLQVEAQQLQQALAQERQANRALQQAHEAERQHYQGREQALQADIERLQNQLAEMQQQAHQQQANCQQQLAEANQVIAELRAGGGVPDALAPLEAETTAIQQQLVQERQAQQAREQPLQDRLARLRQMLVALRQAIPPDAAEQAILGAAQPVVNEPDPTQGAAHDIPAVNLIENIPEIVPPLGDEAAPAAVLAESLVHVPESMPLIPTTHAQALSQVAIPDPAIIPIQPEPLIASMAADESAPVVLPGTVFEGESAIKLEHSIKDQPTIEPPFRLPAEMLAQIRNNHLAILDFNTAALPPVQVLPLEIAHYKHLSNLLNDLVGVWPGDGTIRVWDIMKNVYLQTIKVEVKNFYTSPVHGTMQSEKRIVVGLPNNCLAVVTNNITIEIWDIESGKCNHVLKGHTGEIYPLSLVLLPDGRLVSGGKEPTIRIWDVENGMCVQTIQGGGKDTYVWSLVSLPRGLLAETADGELLKNRQTRLYDVESGSCLWRYGGSSVFRYHALPDGRLAIVNLNDTIILCDTVSNTYVTTRPRKDLNIGIGMAGSTPGVFTPFSDGRVALSAWDTNDSRVCLWEIASNTCVQTLESYKIIGNKAVHFHKILSDGRLFVSYYNGRAGVGVGDNVVLIWPTFSLAFFESFRLEMLLNTSLTKIVWHSDYLLPTEICTRLEAIVARNIRLQLRQRGNPTYTLLHLAAEENDKETLDALLTQPDINLTVQDIYGNTAFQLATQNGHLALAEILSIKSSQTVKPILVPSMTDENQAFGDLPLPIDSAVTPLQAPGVMGFMPPPPSAAKGAVAKGAAPVAAGAM